MNDKLPLEQLGRYRLVRVLGKGAMGVVYEGLDPRLNRQVAVKTILKSQLLDEDTAADYSARFVREAQAVARLSHPNIVTVFDFGEENEIAYIVMEFIRGRELKDYFDKNEFFSIDEAVRMMCELLDALDYAHKLGIIHRDIKPANLMLDASGRVKLTDFGVARLTDAGHDRTMAGTMVGTPSYMSPEQIKGEAVGPRSDLFAAGVILYQFLTRQKPFQGQGQWSIQKKILEEDPLPPSSFKAVAIPAAFDRIVKRALAKNPEDRYPSAGAFAADLKHALERARAPVEDDSTQVAPARKGPGGTPDWAQSTVQFDSTVAEPRAPATAAAPASVDVAAKRPAAAPRPAAPAPVAAVPPPPPPPRAAAAPPRVEEAPAEAPRSKMPLIAGGVGALVLIAAVAGWVLTRGGAPATQPQPPAAAVQPATPEPPAQVAKIEPSPGKPSAEDEQARLRRLDEERRAQEDARRREEEARQAEEAAKRKAEEAAKARAPADDAKARAQEEARRKADEAARRKADEAAQKKAQEEAQRKAAEEARLKAEQDARATAEQEAKLKAEQDAKAKAEQEARAKAQQEAQRKAEEEAKKKAAEDEVKRKAAEAEAARKARTPADLIAEASQLERDGKVAQAVRLYKDAASKGSGPAAKKLGEIYGKGAGDVGRDYAESVKWYSVARERGESVPTPR